MRYYDFNDVQNKLHEAIEAIEDAKNYAEDLEELEQENEDLKEKVDDLEEQVEGLEETLYKMRDATNLNDIIKWWLNALSEDNKYKVWSLAYNLFIEQQDQDQEQE